MSAPASTQPRRKRPTSVTFFALAVLYLGTVNWTRAWLSLDSSSFVATLPLTMPLSYLAACGLVWGLVFTVAALGIWRLWSWARRFVLGAVVVYQLHIWLNHFIFDTSDYARQIWPFQAWVSVMWTILTWGFMFWPGIRRLYSSGT